MEPELIDPAQPEARQLEAVSRSLSARLHKTQILTRIEPLYDSEHELKGYTAYAKP